MKEEQVLTTIERESLCEVTAKAKADGCRLVQICCTLGDDFEITYTFGKDKTAFHYRIHVSREDRVIPSITGIFLAAFTYENELQDLFGLTITNLAVNFNGNFYRTKIKTPFFTEKKSDVKPTEVAK